MLFKKKEIKRVVIGGCRDYYDYDTFCKFVDMCLSRLRKENKVIILSGHCSGTDIMAEKYAKDNRLGLEVYPADWDRYGRSAGPIRNREMVEKSDFVIAFWDGQSRGTKSLIESAKLLERPLRIKDITETI